VGLQVYRRKRKFDVTPEPRGRVHGAEGNQFVIQKHAARRLHYDLRLELGGVMKSWAITRGPSLVPGEKRLAVHVEDHPIEYNAFEGTIPPGEYGGGTVMIWDRGRWYPEGDPYAGYKKGHLALTLDGEKLHGRWHLVRMHGRAGEKKEPWLLIKSQDEEARSAKDPDILEQEPLSVVSGRSMSEIAEGKGRKRVWHSTKSVQENVKAGATKGHVVRQRASTVKRARQRARSPRERTASPKTGKGSTSKSKDKDRRLHGAPLPNFVPPSLATLHSTPPSGSGWAHEIKFDGYRIQARLDDGDVRLLTRKGLDWSEKFPNIAAAVAKLPARTAMIDGEVVVEDKNGISSFSELQAALKEGERERFIYYVFDLLHLDGRDLMSLPLIERKAELARLPETVRRGPIKYSEHFEEDGAAVLRHACQMRLEGIVSKRVDAPYRSGRSDAFIKTKCSNAQELVVGGYSPSTALPRAIGALAVGYYDHGRLVYAGRVGTGYTRTMARDLWKRLHPLEISAPPFDQIPRAEARRSDVRWVEPKMVIEANLRGWTSDGIVRQAAFKGVREDKSPQEVVREKPATTAAAASATTPAKVAAEMAKTMTRTSKATARPSEGKSSSGRQDGASDVRFTHPDRVYWPDVGITKRDLADYYRSVWDWMAPHIVNRPLALVRCPDGTSGQCFFQKHASAGLTEENLRTVIDRNRRQVIAVEDLNAVLSLVQAGVLELHVRGSMIDRLDFCNRIVFDIDPGEGVAWASVVAAARDVRDRLAALDLQSFVKLSGGKGLHVVLPIDGADWRTTKNFAQAVALAMTADDPNRYVAKITKSLRKGKIFVDYLRNSLEQTSVAAYSTRARPGAAVSAPVTWEELGRTKGGNQYTMLNQGRRLSGLKQDPWKNIGRLKQTLPDLRTLRRR
jgi:bifunctional non-homologous end joining protein LigD